jgi:hypothetical protein
MFQPVAPMAGWAAYSPGVRPIGPDTPAILVAFHVAALGGLGWLPATGHRPGDVHFSRAWEFGCGVVLAHPERTSNSGSRVARVTLDRGRFRAWVSLDSALAQAEEPIEGHAPPAPAQPASGGTVVSVEPTCNTVLPSRVRHLPPGTAGGPPDGPKSDWC